MTQAVKASKPILIFAYGNLSRGDDALGPLLIDKIKDKIDLDTMEILTDFQLQIEHALDLENRKLVLFIDASVICNTAFNFFHLQAMKDPSFTTHEMSPAAILMVYQRIKNSTPPPSFLLSIQGIDFELGQGLSQQAIQNLHLAQQFVEKLLKNSQLNFWLQNVGHTPHKRKEEENSVA